MGGGEEGGGNMCGVLGEEGAEVGEGFSARERLEFLVHMAHNLELRRSKKAGCLL